MWLTTRERGRESLNQSFISRREDWNGLQGGGVGWGGWRVKAVKQKGGTGQIVFVQYFMWLEVMD
jgi:hypothetical protein